MARKRILGWAVCGGAAGVLLAATPRGRARIQRLLRRAARKARYEGGRLEGLRYRVAGRHPDATVGGPLLADRVRSVLGPVEHRLDIPRVHVMAVDHTVLLHGDVATSDQVDEVVDVVSRVPGVERVDSHLQVGFFRGETRPSERRWQHSPSEAMKAVLAAARGGGAAPGTELDTVRSVGRTFLSLLPAGERRHVLTHLPVDLRHLVQPPRRARLSRRPRTRSSFVATALPDAPVETGETIVASVLGALRDLVPEEAIDVAAVLPSELRHLWKVAIPL